jgi:hypothetical protein
MLWCVTGLDNAEPVQEFKLVEEDQRRPLAYMPLNNSALSHFEDLVCALIVEKLSTWRTRFDLDYWRPLLAILRSRFRRQHLLPSATPSMHPSGAGLLSSSESVASSYTSARYSLSTDSSYSTACSSPLTSRNWRHWSNTGSVGGVLRNIGNFHPWHGMTPDERRQAFEAYDEAMGLDGQTCARDYDRGPPPPGRLSKEELGDFEDLLLQLLTRRRSERATAANIENHPWLNKTYTARNDGHFLVPYIVGDGLVANGIVYI